MTLFSVAESPMRQREDAKHPTASGRKPIKKRKKEFRRELPLVSEAKETKFPTVKPKGREVSEGY